jgi:general stress protein 26
MIQTDPRDLLARFWRDLADLRTGMLGLATEHEGHAQPMTAHFEGEHGPLWFYAHAHSRIALAAEQSHAAVFHYVGRKHDLYACIHGEVATRNDETAIAHFWSEEVARWYPNGPRPGPGAAVLHPLQRADLAAQRRRPASPVRHGPRPRSAAGHPRGDPAVAGLGRRRSQA